MQIGLCSFPLFEGEQYILNYTMTELLKISLAIKNSIK